jgi:hypothetical protein
LAVVKNTLFPYRLDLETVDETGAQPLRIAGGGPRKRPLPEEFTPPSWSPDGSMMVFKGLAGRVDQGLRGMRLFRASTKTAAVLGASQSTLSLREAMDEGLIVLFCPGHGGTRERLIANLHESRARHGRARGIIGEQGLPVNEACSGKRTVIGRDRRWSG